ncbi:serine protease [Xanthomonas campestris]|uniref:serine protease n=1 Tax=Xanthomonas campestris TaxID=339 RepID=UPI001E4326E5|nr:serine protease [Xanthomonas campestris]MCC4604689.1 serine protease [Xanthomonas campestris pv. parthenii]
MEWHEGIKEIEPHLVHITTPRGSGTGWLVSVSATTDLCAIATAAHVVDYAHYWEMPIRIFHPASGRSVLFRVEERAIHLESEIDSAAIVINRRDLPFPDQTLTLIEPGYFIKPGVEIGWLGFPAVHPSNACFFSGRISYYNEDRKQYLVDGVAINGVSGGPTFRLLTDKPELVGIVSAYIANRATGETLPGVAVIQDVAQYYDIAERFRNLDEAKSNETPAEETAEADHSYASPAREI